MASFALLINLTCDEFSSPTWLQHVQQRKREFITWLKPPGAHGYRKRECWNLGEEFVQRGEAKKKDKKKEEEEVGQKEAELQATGSHHLWKTQPIGVTIQLSYVCCWLQWLQQGMESMNLLIPSRFVSWNNSFSDISRKYMLPNMIRVVPALSYW